MNTLTNTNLIKQSDKLAKKKQTFLTNDKNLSGENAETGVLVDENDLINLIKLYLKYTEKKGLTAPTTNITSLRVVW